jgi:exodeoxyribonuclease-3
MHISTWNVNSIRARHDRVLGWLQAHQPDALCLQELKMAEDEFPHQAISDAGFHATVLGQPTYNGVAIVSREEPAEVRLGMDDGVDDPQARLVAALIGDVWVLSAYFPNGGEVGSDKWAYKLEWMRRLRDYLDARFGQMATHMVNQ